MQFQFAADELFYFLLSVARRISSGSDGHDPLGIEPPASGGLNPLPRLPAVADNAAMEAEPKAELPNRKRRRFQFRLMLIILLMTLASVIGATIHQYREAAKFNYERLNAEPIETRGASQLQESAPKQ